MNRLLKLLINNLLRISSIACSCYIFVLLWELTKIDWGVVGVILGCVLEDIKLIVGPLSITDILCRI